MQSETTPKSINELEPRAVWQFFSDLTAIPRESKKEEAVRAYLRSVAERSGLPFREDAVGNIVMQVPASAGCEKAPITVLQGHVDMVCEKNSDTDHDFDRDGIRTIIEREPNTGEMIVRAAGTTLGADNGIGVAFALAAATSPETKHGPLELLFTVDEEAGMTGASALTPDSISGRRLLNLDSEEDNVNYVGCAGGCDSNLSWNLELQPIDAGLEVASVTVSGLRGGHSGCDIHENRANAIQLLATVLAAGAGRLRIVNIVGGSKRNAIPREATAIVAAPSAVMDALRQSSKHVQLKAINDCGDRNTVVIVEDVHATEQLTALTASDTSHLVDALLALPNGVLGQHPSIEGLVQTSNNVSTITFAAQPGAHRGRVAIGTLTRSSSNWWMDAALAQIGAVGRLAGAEVLTANRYPGWEPRMDSELLATCRRVYAELFGESPLVTAIHAGLECGIIGERVGEMDMVSFGPTIRGAHSPDERVYIASVQKSWTYLTAVLIELSSC